MRNFISDLLWHLFPCETKQVTLYGKTFTIKKIDMSRFRSDAKRYNDAVAAAKEKTHSLLIDERIEGVMQLKDALFNHQEAVLLNGVVAPKLSRGVASRDRICVKDILRNYPLSYGLYREIVNFAGDENMVPEIPDTAWPKPIK